MVGYLESGQREDCCGCNACYNTCSQQAISMKEDDEGYLYPVIDEVKCIHCGACRRVCLFSEKAFHYVTEGLPKIYIAWNRDEQVRKTSSSGGVFSAISDTILMQGGIVYGAKFADDFTVVHAGATSALQRNEFKESKYVQSQMRQTYFQIKEQLLAGRLVLLTGTPCQVSGLYAYLGRKYDTLLTMDIICHGVPSPGVFRNYLRFLCRKFSSQISEIHFRDKTKGWGAYYLKVYFKNGKIYKTKAMNDFFYRLFLKNYFVRPVCYRCPFKKIPRESDVTLGDFWSSQPLKQKWKDKNGVSLLLLNTEFGRKIVLASMANMEYENVSRESSLQGNLQEAKSEPAGRKNFFQDYAKVSWKNLYWKYFLVPLVLDFPLRLWQRIKK